MKIKKAKNLAHKADHDKLTKNEITEILQELHGHLNEEREYNRSVVATLIEIIGCLGVSSGIKVEYQQVVEKFLYFPKDSYITRTALEVIIHVWDLSTFYMNYIKVMMHGVVWEEESMVRWFAITAAGICFGQINDMECLEYLVSVFDDKKEEMIDRNWAHDAIASAMGISYPSTVNHVIDDARKILLNPKLTANGILQMLDLPGDLKRSKETALFDKAYEAKITPEEVSEVIEQLKQYIPCNNLRPGFECWSLLQALRFIGIHQGVTTDYTHLLEQFLSYREFPFISADVLSILCLDWHLSKAYIGKIKEFMKGPEWDNGSVRSIALKAAGELLQEVQDRECLEYLAAVLEYDADFDVRYLAYDMRYLAYMSLLQALHIDPKNTPYIDQTEIHRHHPFLDEIVKKARSLIMENRNIFMT